MINKTADGITPNVVSLPKLTYANVRLNQRLSVRGLSNRDPYVSSIRYSPFASKSSIYFVTITVEDKISDAIIKEQDISESCRF